MTQRRTAWLASGIQILEESSGDLADGRKYIGYIVESPEKQQTFFLFTALGEKYLEVSGEGDLALVAEIARTLRSSK